MSYPSSGAKAPLDTAPADNPPPDPAQAAFLGRMRWMMRISGATTALAIGAVLAVIGYRLSHQEGSAGPDVTARLPKGARIVATSATADRLAVTVDVGGSLEIRTFDIKTLRPAGTLKFATEP